MLWARKINWSTILAAVLSDLVKSHSFNIKDQILILGYLFSNDTGGKPKLSSNNSNKHLFSTLMPQRNASKFAIFLQYENPHSFFNFSFYATFPPNECPGQWPHNSIREKENKVAWNEKQKNLCGFSYSKNIANFGAFHWGIKLRINLLFLKSVVLTKKWTQRCT